MAASRKDRVKGLYDAFVHPSAQSKVDVDTEASAKPDVQEFVEQETPTEPNPQPEVHVDAHSHPQASTQTYTQANQQADVFANVRKALGQEKATLESQRRRQTFWLSEDDITALDKVHKATGLPKYQIVSEAIQAVYKHVLGAGQE